MRHRKLALLLAALSSLTACDLKTPDNQATHEMCQFTWGGVQENMRDAKNKTGIDKLYQVELAHMNLEIALAKGCCKYSDTCPALMAE